MPISTINSTNAKQTIGKMTTAVVATSSSALREPGGGPPGGRAVGGSASAAQRVEIAVAKASSPGGQEIEHDEDIDSVEAEYQGDMDAVMAEEEEKLMREDVLIVKHEEAVEASSVGVGQQLDRSTNNKQVERDMLTTALVNSVVETRGARAAASENMFIRSSGVANPLAAKPALPSPTASLGGGAGSASSAAPAAAASASAAATSTPTRRSPRRTSTEGGEVGAANSAAVKREDKSRSPVMTRRRAGAPPVLSIKAREAIALAEPTATKPQSAPRAKRHSNRSGGGSGNGNGKAGKPSTGKKKKSVQIQQQQPKPLPAKPTVPNVMAAAASFAAPQPQVVSSSMPPPAMRSNPGSVVPSPALSGASGSRARIFSIDLDAAGIDFGIGGTTEGMQLPTASRKNTHEDDPASAPGRLRGMSFELFSFGIGADEPLPPPAPAPAPAQPVSSSTTDMMPVAAGDGGGRPRGDSIIFDPVSFCDGGIHETNALTKCGSRRASIDEVDIMNSPGFVEGPTIVASNHPGAPNASAAAGSSSRRRKHSLEGVPIPSPLTISSSSTTKPAAAAVSVSNSASASASASAAKLSGLTPAAVKYTSISSSPVPPFSGQTISMPHGSAAAAAAALSLPASNLPQTTLPSSLNGTAIAHTACPMELLNKGGRIGIYLPEARKARIEKFHSKRKNRIWRKRIKYDCRKKLADSRPRIKGRFVKRTDMDEDSP